MEDATTESSATGQPTTTTGQSGKGYLVISVIIALISAAASLGTTIATNNSKHTSQSQLESYQQQQQRQQEAYQQQQQTQQAAYQKQQSRLSACKDLAVALGQAISDIDSVILQDSSIKLKAATTDIDKIDSTMAYARPRGAVINNDLPSRLNDIENILENVPVDIGALRDRRSHLHDDESNLCD